MNASSLFGAVAFSVIGSQTDAHRGANFGVGTVIHFWPMAVSVMVGSFLASLTKIRNRVFQFLKASVFAGYEFALYLHRIKQAYKGALLDLPEEYLVLPKVPRRLRPSAQRSKSTPAVTSNKAGSLFLPSSGLRHRGGGKQPMRDAPRQLPLFEFCEPGKECNGRSDRASGLLQR